MTLFYSLFIYLWLIQNVYGNYCEWGYCKSKQYCCGDNQCCDSDYSIWYFWLGIGMVVFLSLCGGLCRHYYQMWRLRRKGPQFTTLPTTSDENDPLYQDS